MNDKWIKCSDRLPDEGIEVLAWDGESIIISWRYDENKSYRDRARIRKDKYPPDIKWYYSCCSWPGEISYWMELPEKPNEQ